MNLNQNFKIINSIKCHKSGVVCIDNNEKFIFTGGEDGDISILHDGVVIQKIERAHNAQISGIKLLTVQIENRKVNLLISASLDQRINVFRLTDTCDIIPEASYKTAVSDLTGFDAVRDGSTILIALAGQGLQLILYNHHESTTPH